LHTSATSTTSSTTITSTVPSSTIPSSTTLGGSVSSSAKRGQAQTTTTSSQPQAKRPKPAPVAVAPVPYDEILKGVTFTLSGYQDPSRGNIRSRATAMGASYQRNWTRQCTHCIAAFETTPKNTDARSTLSSL
jgi:DNA-repair protein XRCC1